MRLGRFSGATFAAALLLCAFPVATSSQDKNAPSNVEKNLEVLEDNFEKLKAKLDADLLKTKRELEQRIDAINRRLDDLLIAQLSVRRGAVNEPSPDYGNLQSCCRHINYPVPVYVYHHEPCCRDDYHRVRHVYHPTRIYHPQPCCRYASHELDWR
jgi:hypothetical protein